MDQIEVNVKVMVNVKVQVKLIVEVMSLKIDTIDIGHRPCFLRVENISSLAGLYVMLSQTWSRNGPQNKLHRHGLYAMFTQS